MGKAETGFPYLAARKSHPTSLIPLTVPPLPIVHMATHASDRRVPLQPSVDKGEVSAESCGCVVFLRHGEREDNVAKDLGNGAAWVSKAQRPWDPRMTENGRRQTRAAVR